MIPTSYWRKSWGAFVTPNTCAFEILDVSCLQEPTSLRIIHLYQVELRCLCCQAAFAAKDGQGMSTVIGARVFSCPAGCGTQAIANAALQQFVAGATTPVVADTAARTGGSIAAGAQPAALGA